MSTFWLKYRGTRFPIRRGETLLGRSAYCSIVLSNPLASRQHCALRLDAGALVIEDLESSNGTWVNGERIDKARALVPGDLLRVGTDVLEVIVADADMPVRERESTSHDRQSSVSEDDATASLDTIEATSTKTHGTTLDLLEQLVMSAGETRRPAALAASIQRVVEALVEQSRRTQQPLSGAHVTRVSAVVEKLSSWFEQGELDEWRSRMLTSVREPREEKPG
jgi:pSer/pThr/pTyr-binding forkhead associated (FHA) protein